MKGGSVLVILIAVVAIILIVTIGTFIFTSLRDDAGGGTNGEVQELEIVTYTQDDLQGENADQIPDFVRGALEDSHNSNVVETTGNFGELANEEGDSVIGDTAQQAFEEDNIDTCLNLEGVEQNVCYDNFYFLKFQEEKDFSYCEQITSTTLRSNCLDWDTNKFGEAINSRDITICAELIEEESRAFCEEEVNALNGQ